VCWCCLLLRSHVWWFYKIATRLVCDARFSDSWKIVCAVGNSDEERRWFNEAMHSQVVDVIKRMKEIALVMSMPVPVLEAQGVTVEELEGEVINTIQHSLGVSLGCWVIVSYNELYFCDNSPLIFITGLVQPHHCCSNCSSVLGFFFCFL